MLYKTLLAFALVVGINAQEKEPLPVPKKFTASQALTIRSVSIMSKTTPFRASDYIDKAVANQHWQNANVHLHIKDKAFRKDNVVIPSFDYKYVISELRAAASEDVVIAAYQGYVILMQITQGRGDFFKENIPFFASKMMKANMCEGFYETGRVYARGWINKKYDYATALNIVNEGTGACSAYGVPQWQKNYWGEDKARYTVLLRLENEKK